MSDARLVLAKEFIMLCILSSQLVPVPSDRVEDDEDFFAEDQAGTTIPLAGCLQHACNWYGILRLVAAFQKKVKKFKKKVFFSFVFLLLLINLYRIMWLPRRPPPDRLRKHSLLECLILAFPTRQDRRPFLRHMLS